MATCLSCLALLWTTRAAAENPDGPEPHRPNVVFFFVDDLGWRDLAAFGSGYYETPHADELAATGMRFTAAYANGPNCAPTRACLMSGQYTPRHGIYTVGTSQRGKARFRKLIPTPNRTTLPPDIVTLAQALQQSGYATGHFGKWHLGDRGALHPSQRGFDEAVVSMGRHFNFRTNPPSEVAEGTYLADHLTDLALDFIQRHRDEPFFLYLSHFAVHTPIQAQEKLIQRFRAKAPRGGHRNPVYGAMIASMDASLGRVLATLKQLDLEARTVVIFFSDNGGYGPVTSMKPLRGAKGMLYEGGIRVPCMVRWPGVTPPGSTCDEPIIGVDFYPTLLQIAKAQAPAGHTLDGVSLVPLLQDPGATLDREAIFWHFPVYLEAYRGGRAQGPWRTTPAGAVRAGPWKLIQYFEDGRLELYNLSEDIGEQNNLAGAKPAKARAMHARLLAWRRTLEAPVPTQTNPKYDPAATPKGAG